MKIKSFGCSLVYGSDLSDQHMLTEADNHSLLTWPSLMAKFLGLEYECHAWPGIGNFKILCDVITQASMVDPAVFVINWTWIDRFDYIDDNERWQTVLPGQDCQKAQAYYRYFHSHLKDVLSAVYNINTAALMLRDRNIPFVMTYMDYNILQPIDPNWHDPRYLASIQKNIQHLLLDFEGKNFLDWSRSKGLRISDLWHPLEEAHAAAAELMLPAIDAILRKA